MGIFHWFLKPNGVSNGEARVVFYGKKSSASTLTEHAKVVGRFTHELGSVRRSLELRFTTQNSEMEGSELHAVGVLGSEQSGFIRLQIVSTDRYEYSATSVDVFTHCFHVLFDLGT